MKRARERIQFRAELIAGHKGVIAAIVPFDPEVAWGRPAIALDARRRGWLVAGKLDGVAFDGWIGHRWGRFFIIVDEALRSAARVAAGDTVEVVVAPTARGAALDVAHAQAPLTTASRRRPDADTPAQVLARALDAFDPAIARQTRAVLAAMRRRLPGAVELLYDNYNALAIGFAPTERASDAVFSIAVYPRWVSLFFLKDGVHLPDPAGRLRGGGTKVRHIVLERGARTLDEPEVRALMAEALRRAGDPFDPRQKRRLLVKSVSARRRPRRPC
jgi:uncharacterized protein DUF1905